MIIALCGAQGAGKDTVGDILVNKFGFHRLSFGSALKDMISVLFSWPRHLLEGNTEESRIWREQVNEYWAIKTKILDFSPRKALQLIGTDCLRNHFCQDIWVHIVESKINHLLSSSPSTKIVITDCRFVNEFEMVQKFNNSLIVKIERRSSEGVNKQDHVSEIDWQSFPFSHIIQNDNTIEVLEKEINKIFIK